MPSARRALPAPGGPRVRWVAPALLAAIGMAALAVGLLVYMTDRDPARVQLFPQFAALHTGPLFGVLGSWLPSFVHPFAFSLLTAAALPRSSSPAYRACAAWWVVNLAFELGQHERFSAGLAEAAQAVFGHTWLARALSNYALRGRFDVADVVALTAGALAAAAVLFLAHRLEMRDAH